MTDVPGRTAKEKLENEIYQYTGIKGDGEKLLYLMGLMIRAFDLSLDIIHGADAPGPASRF